MYLMKYHLFLSVETYFDSLHAGFEFELLNSPFHDREARVWRHDDDSVQLYQFRWRSASEETEMAHVWLNDCWLPVGAWVWLWAGCGRGYERGRGYDRSVGVVIGGACVLCYHGLESMPHISKASIEKRKTYFAIEK